MRNAESHVQAAKSFLNVTGVYSIRNRVSGRVYIGSGVRIGIRWRHHLKLLKAGKHFNLHLQNAWNLYGADAFEFEVVEITSRELLTQREQYYLSALQPGYNIGATATAPWLGKKISESHRARISLSLRGRKKTSDHARNISIGKKGNTKLSAEHRALLLKYRVKTWQIIKPDGTQIIIENLNRFCKENGLVQGCMGRVASGERNHHKGWRCKSVQR